MKFYHIVDIWLIVLAVISGSQCDFRQCRDCQGVIKTRQTIVTSPRYPENYPSSTCCDYILRSPYRCPSNYHIQFLDFSVEPSSNCVNDFLAIGDVGDADVDVRNYNDDVLCGRVTGIKKYHSQDGVLRVRFATNDVLEDRGFRLLITRLSCEETTAPNITYHTTHKEPTVTLPNLDLLPPLQGKHTKPEVPDLTKQTNNYQGEQYLPPSEGYLPNNPTYPFYPQSPASSTPTNNGYLPPGSLCPSSPPLFQGNPYNPPYNNRREQLPTGSCCAGSFRHHRFYLTSPDFPARADANPPHDCFYYIERSGPNVCRVRVVFRFFALGSANAYSGECVNDFIEIDGERMCGCRTGFVYTRDFGLGAKLIRLKTYGRLTFTTSIGFLLDVIQEDCGVRYSRQVGAEPNKLIPHPIVETNSTTRTKVYLHNTRTEPLGYSSKDGVNSKLIFSPANACEFGFADLLRISFDPLWVTRRMCYSN